MIVLLQWVVFGGTQPTFEFVMQQYCYCIIINHFLLNMKCVFEQMQTMCLSNCKPSVTNMPTIFILTIL